MAWRSSGTTNDEMVDNLKRKFYETFFLSFCWQNSDLIPLMIDDDDAWRKSPYCDCFSSISVITWEGLLFINSTTFLHHHHHCLFVGLKEQVLIVWSQPRRKKFALIKFVLCCCCCHVEALFWLRLYFHNRTLEAYSNTHSLSLLLFIHRISSHLINRYWIRISFCGS